MNLTELMGTAGTVSVEFASWDRAVVSLYEAEREQWQRETLVTDRDDMFRAEDLEFLRATATGGRVALGLEEARRSLEIIEAAHAAGDTPGAARTH